MEESGYQTHITENNIVDNQAVISAEYEMKQVSAKLYITYTINNQGAVQVNQK